jgi:hypothetical protein
MSSAVIGVTGAIVAGAAVASAGVGAYDAYSSSKQTSFADSIASTEFSEQQGMYSQLMSLLENPSSFASNPSYQFALNQGSKQVAANMASSGYAGSGNEAIALQQFGQQEAYSGLLSQEQLLASLSGLGASSSSAQNVSAATSSSSNSYSQLLSMLPILGATSGGVSSLFGGSTAGVSAWSPGIPDASGLGLDVG